MKQAHSRAQNHYLTLVRNEKSPTRGISKLEKLVQISGVEPSKEVIRQTFLQYIQGLSIVSDTEVLSRFFQKYSVSQVVSEDEIHAMYDRLFDEKDYFDIERIVKVTGVKPKFDEARVQEAYVNTLEKDVCSVFVKYIEKISGVKPAIPEELVQARYRELLKEGKEHDLFLCRELHEATGI